MFDTSANLICNAKQFSQGAIATLIKPTRVQFNAVHTKIHYCYSVITLYSSFLFTHDFFNIFLDSFAMWEMVNAVSNNPTDTEPSMSSEAKYMQSRSFPCFNQRTT